MQYKLTAFDISGAVFFWNAPTPLSDLRMFNILGVPLGACRIIAVLKLAAIKMFQIMLSRISFVIVFICCATSVQAQSLRVVDSLGNELSNDTIFVEVNVSNYDVQVPAGVENVSGNDVSVNITRIEENVMPNTSSFFCWGTCTGVMTSGQYPSLTPSGSVLVTAGETVPGNGDGFLFHYDPNWQAGTSLFKFDFFDINDTTDFASVYISITSVENNVAIEEQIEIALEVYPNPTEQFVKVVIPTDIQATQIRVLDVFGREVNRFQALSSFLTIDLPQESGIYFIEVLTADQQLILKKVIKS